MKTASTAHRYGDARYGESTMGGDILSRGGEVLRDTDNIIDSVIFCKHEYEEN